MTSARTGPGAHVHDDMRSMSSWPADPQGQESLEVFMAGSFSRARCPARYEYPAPARLANEKLERCE